MFTHRYIIFFSENIIICIFKFTFFESLIHLRTTTMNRKLISDLPVAVYKPGLHIIIRYYGGFCFIERGWMEWMNYFEIPSES